MAATAATAERAAGSRAANLAPAIAKVARSRDIELAVAETLGSTRARLRATGPGSRVVVAGGDGTLQRLLSLPLEGRFELVLAGRFGRVGTLAMMPLLLAALHVHHPRVRIETFFALAVESSRPLPPTRRLPVHVLPQAIAVVRRGR